jgi:hypothetical protein
MTYRQTKTLKEKERERKIRQTERQSDLKTDKKH